MRNVHLAATLVLALAACGRGSGAAAQKGGRPVAVRAVAAVQKDMPIELRAVGRIVSNQSVAVRAQVSGPLVAAHFTEGQNVAKGALLLEIDRRPFAAALAEAKARLAQDRARAENARADATRYGDLVEKEYVTRQQADGAKSNATAMDAAVAADEAAVQRAALSLSYCAIRAPVSGRTGRLLVNVGNLVAAGGPEPLVTLEQVRPVFAAFSVPERDLATLRARRGGPPPVRIRTSSGAEVAGKLDFMDNAVDPSTGTILLKARIPNEDEALWPGQAVDVFLRVGEQSKAIVVPAGAVAQGQQGDYVYVVGAAGKAELRTVNVAVAGDRETVLTRGVAPGEMVVTEGQLKLLPGTPVEILGEKGPAR